MLTANHRGSGFGALKIAVSKMHDAKTLTADKTSTGIEILYRVTITTSGFISMVTLEPNNFTPYDIILL